MNDFKDKWQGVLDDLFSQVTSISYDLWIKNLTPYEIQNDKLIILASNATVKKQCLKNHYYLLSEAISNHFQVNEYEILDPSEKENYLSTKVVEQEIKNVEERRKSQFNSKYTFDNFVVGKSNQFVYSAALAVAENPAIRFNPLFIYGGVGLGKTHLLHSIGNYLYENNKELNIVYATCENFTNDYIEVIRDKTKSIASFREKYRNADVLMIDDIQFITNKDAVQEEFFHTFNDLYQNNKQIIISSDRPPKEIATLQERLQSRFSMGLMQDIQQPDFETRYAILQKKAMIDRCDISQEALIYIAENVVSNIRELEGVLSKTVFLTTLIGNKTATLAEAKQALNDTQLSDDRKITPNNIIDAVCSYYNIERKELLGKKRNKEIVMPRQVCMYIITDMLDLPLITIGKDIFGRDHTTVIHARNKIIDKMKTDTKLETIVKDIKNMVLNK